MWTLRADRPWNQNPFVEGGMNLKKTVLAALVAGGMTLGAAAPAFATGEEPPEPSAKCNSGRGNDSETTPDNDCDPGNSGGRNNGGD
jgi:hypothetical protein